MRVVLVIPFLVCACDGVVGGPIVLTADVSTAPADGLSTVVLRAQVRAPEAGVVRFESTKGTVAASTVPVVNGEATVELWAPHEDELQLAPSVTSTITGTVILDGAEVKSSAAVDFTFPTEGPARIVARAEPDTVLAGSNTPITLIVDGIRLAAPDITIRAERLALDETIAVAADGPIFHTELTLTPPSTTGDVDVTITAGNVTTTVTVDVVGENDPLFNLDGTFAQVSYSHVTAKAFFLEGEGNRQTVVAPSFSLVTIEQDGVHIKMTSTTCEIQMPPVKVLFIDDCLVPTVEAGFIEATNRRAPPPLEFDLTDIDLPAEYTLGADAFPIPTILGAINLANPMTDPLPDSDNDPTEFDDDGDGEPGVTIKAGSNVQKVAMRTKVTRMTATITDSHTIDGDLQSDTETSAIDSLVAIEPEITNHPSPFHMRRVDGDNVPTNIAGLDGAAGISCADVITFKDELLALAPPPVVADICGQE